MCHVNVTILSLCVREDDAGCSEKRNKNLGQPNHRVKRNTGLGWRIATGLAAAAAVAAANAQSSDALIDKLVDKGILTVKEANDLRAEADKDFAKAYAVKSGMPEWVNSLKFNGDVRLRYDGLYRDEAGFVDRNRFRYRLRFGAVANLADDFEVGLRLASGTNGTDPISSNETMQDNAVKKGITLDTVYAKWNPIHTASWNGTLIGGKMENPLVFSDLIFDQDYTPEGLGQQVVYTINDKHSVKFNAGEFVLDEIGGSSRDPYLVAGQVRLDSTWNAHWQSSLGVSGLAVSGKDGLRGVNGTTAATVPDVNVGNTRDAQGALVNNYNPWVADASVVYTLESFPMYAGAFPIRVGGDYAQNPGADLKNSAYSVGITFGKSGKRGTWDLGYRYKYLESDFWWEELVDSDSGTYYSTAPLGGRRGYQPGTNIRGHVVRAMYSPFDSLTVGFTYFLLDAIEASPLDSGSTIGRLQVDAVFKF